MTLTRTAIAQAGENQHPHRNFGLIFLCLVLSAWVHVAGFVFWQKALGDGTDRFFFTVMDDSPVLELTLVFDEPVEEVRVEEAVEALPPPEEITSIEEPPPAFVPAEGANILDDALLQTELLAAAQAEEGLTVNPDPPVVLEPEAPEFKRYETSIRSAIARRWIIPPQARENFRPGRLTADVTIAENGELLRIVVVESSGNATLDHAGLEALRAAAPYPPLPAYLGGLSQWTIRINFDYQAQYVQRQQEQKKKSRSHRP